MQYLSRARKLAARSTQSFKHAAIVFKGGAFIAEATNTSAYHAEVAALRRARRKTSMDNLTLISIRIGKSGQLRLGKPCPDCLAYMTSHGVVTVWYSTGAGFDYLRI